MDDEQVRQDVVRRLAEGIDQRDIILDICRNQGLGWGQAESLVAQIASTATGEIARRRFPLFAFLALGIVLAGLALIGNFVFVVLVPLVDSGVRSAPGGIVSAGGLIGWLILNLEFVGQLGLGVAMVVGGAMGLFRVMRETLHM